MNRLFDKKESWTMDQDQFFSHESKFFSNIRRVYGLR
jgi:hypothetical protein